MDIYSQPPLPASLLIDAHVHFYACFDRDTFLDAAARNFAGGAAELGLAGRPFLGCLMLAETAEARWFLRWQRRGGGGKLGAGGFGAPPGPAGVVARGRRGGGAAAGG